MIQTCFIFDTSVGLFYIPYSFLFSLSFPCSSFLLLLFSLSRLQTNQKKTDVDKIRLLSHLLDQYVFSPGQ